MNIILKDLEAAGHDIKALFVKEEPEIKAALEAAVKAVEPIWKTVLGAITLKAVTDAANVAAAGGSVASVESMVSDIVSTAKTAGVTAEGQSVSTLVGLAAQKIAAEAATLSAPPAPAPSPAA